jgi:hypothetical protein
VEQSFVGDAELFGGARFVPLGFAERVLNFEAFDVGHGALRHFFEGSLPGKLIVQHSDRHVAGGRPGCGQLELLGGDFRAIGEDGGALDRILKLADVSGPGIREQAGAGVASQFQGGLSKFAPETLEKMFCQKQHVIPALAEGRDRDGDGGNSKIKILAKSFSRNGFLKIFVRGGEDADVDFDSLRSADALELLLLEHAQQFALNAEGKLADFVEKQRATVRQLELADFSGSGAGVSAAFVAEEFVFDKPFGNGGSVERHKRMLGARAEMMNRAREELFSGAALSEQENG